MNAEDTKTILAEGVAGLALAASALAEAAQALSEAAAALSAMGQETRPPPTIYQSVEITPRLSEIYQIGNKNGKTQEIHDEANSVGASIGNNAHKRDATPEINFDGDSEQTNPFTHPRDPAPTANHSQAQGEYSSEPKHPDIDALDRLLCPGCFYLVLEEEFDALPLILAYATAGKRTICYLPTSGSLVPWESIISAIIPGRQVRSAISFSGDSTLKLGGIEQFDSSSDGSVLVLGPDSIAQGNENGVHSITDSLIFWGFPVSKFRLSIPYAARQSQHTLLMLTRREYAEPNCQAFISKPDSRFVVHPRQSEFNVFDPTGILVGFRDKVQRAITEPQQSQSIQSIYEDLLEAHINEAARLGFMKEHSLEKIEVVNRFVAAVFLRGRLENGSLRFKPDGRGLPIPKSTFKNLGITFSKRASKGRKSTGVKQSPAVGQSNAPPNSSTVFTHRAGWWRITLQHDADAIPLICYLAKEHPKSVCCISHCQATFSYGTVFSEISAYQVITTGKRQRTIEYALGRFSSDGLQSCLCLLHGHPPEAGEGFPNFKHVKADALIYWGLPAHDSFLWPNRVSQDQFTHVYLIIPPDQLSAVMNPVLAGGVFQDHPDSGPLNAQEGDSLLHPMREKARLVLSSMSHPTIRDILRFYTPAHSLAYPFSEFIKKVMLRDDY